MKLIEKYEREDEIERQTDYLFSKLMEDENEIADVLITSGLSAIWLIKILKFAEEFETDDKFFALVKGMDTGTAFNTLFAAKELRVIVSKYLYERARMLAERT